jgi:mannose-1-phosphate guanylyltransferase/phosphomannomutase
VAVLDEQGRITRFQEKPSPGEAFSDLVNTGIYVVDPQVLEWIPRGEPYDFSRDLFPRLMAQGRPLFGAALEGYWRDIGSIDEYRRSQQDALEGTVRLALPAHPVRPGVWMGPDARVDPGVVIRGSVLLGAGCRIEGRAEVGHGSVIGKGSIVRAGARIEGSILGECCRIGPGARVHDGVLDDEVWVGAESCVCEGAVIGRGCRIAAGHHVEGGQRIEPDQAVGEARARERHDEECVQP